MIPTANAARIPLTPAQRSLLFLDRLYEGTGAANLVAVLDVDGELSADWLAQAFERIFRRHHLLRSRVVECDGQWCFEEGDVPDVALYRADISDYPDPVAELARLIEGERVRRFHDDGPWLVATLLRTGAGRHVLVIVRHHLCSDGWSFAILARDMRDAYNALAAGAALPTDVAPRFDEFALACAAEVTQARGATFWKRRLAGLPRAIPWPRQARPSAGPVAPGAGMRRFSIGTQAVRGLLDLQRASRITPFCSLLGVFTATLWHATGETLLPVGSDVTCRDRRRWEGVVGMFVNRATLRCELEPATVVRGQFNTLQLMLVETLDHKRLPFQEVVRLVCGDRVATAAPLFNVMFGMHNNPHETLRLSGVDRVALRPPLPTAPELDLSFYVTDMPDGTYRVDVGYAVDVLSDTWVDGLCMAFSALVDTLPAHLETTVDAWTRVLDADDDIDDWAALQESLLADASTDGGGH